MTIPRLETLIPEPLRESLFALRRDLHQYPELAFQEARTARRLEEALAAVPGASVRRVAGTGVVARVPGRVPGGPVVAIRGDIDALPIREETGVAFASALPGIMHACGHDVHAAWAVGAAHLLAASPALGDAVILLQPAEETGRGALAMLEAGVLDGVAAVFGAHVDLRFPLGSVVADPGPIAASADEFAIEVVGRGGHAARPQEARDPVVAAAAIVVALQTIVARRLTPGEPAVVTVGTIAAGTAPNIIPERAQLSGTLRAVRAATREVLRHEVTRTAEAVAQAHGVEARVRIRPGTPPIVNAADPIEWARAAVGAVLGPDAFQSLDAPNLGGEDFAYYLERVPGCFLRVGAHVPGAELAMAHSPRFLPDERAILVGAAVLAATARNAAVALAARR